MLASSWADCWVKLPEISALPPVRAWLTYGSETTSPSRTMANWFCGDWFWASRPVMSANFLAPLSENFIVTVQPAPVCVFRTASASSTSVPSTAAGPRMYFCHWPWEFWPQATVDSEALAPSPALARTDSLVQSSAAYWAWSSLSVSPEVPPVADGEGAASPSAEALAEAEGVPSAFRASVSARPWVVELADGLAEADGEEPSVALSVALSLPVSSPEGLPEALGVGAVPPPAISVATTGRK
ncbi:hypothetical protein SGRIM128S_04859 [Streptomyces griseomycini]